MPTKAENCSTKSLQSNNHEYRGHSPKENMTERSIRYSPDG